jgi:hypothetical protein
LYYRWRYWNRKNIFLRKLLKNHKTIIANIKAPINVLWCYGIYQQLYRIPISDDIIIKYVEGIPEEKIINDFKPKIIVVDDLLFEFNKNKNLENIFIKKSTIISV